MSGTAHLGTFRNDHSGKQPITGASRYYHHDVELSDGGTVTVKTNLSEDDLNYLFPSPTARLGWLRSVAKMSTLPKKRK